jgi:hypothetical protein
MHRARRSGSGSIAHRFSAHCASVTHCASAHIALRIGSIAHRQHYASAHCASVHRCIGRPDVLRLGVAAHRHLACSDRTFCA